jgi:type I restriction enzyme S subunit
VTNSTLPLNKVCTFRHGGTPSKSNPQFWGGDIPWVSPKDMKASLITSTQDSITAEGVNGSAASLVPEGSILVVARSGILAHTVPVARAGRRLAFNQDIKAIQVSDNRVTGDYAYWFLRGKEAEILASGVKKGATVHSLQSGFLEKLAIPMVSTSEQYRIVDLLSRAENIVRMRREAQQKAKEVIPALFLDMFGEPGKNPKGWGVTTLGALIADGPQNGLYKPAHAYGSGTPILRIDGFYNGRVKPMSGWKRLRLEPSEAERFRLTEGDIIINRVNSPEYLGKSTLIPYLDEPAVFESNMMRASVDKAEILPEFVIAFLQTSFARSALVKNAKHAINQSSINQGDVKSVPIYKPPISKQAAFRERAAQGVSIEIQQVLATAHAEETFRALLTGVFGEGEMSGATERIPGNGR